MWRSAATRHGCQAAARTSHVLARNASNTSHVAVGALADRARITRWRRPGRLSVVVQAQRKDEQFQFDRTTAKKGYRYIKVVTKYAFGVDIDSYIPLIVAAGSLLALLTFGLSGLFIVAASAIGVILASSIIFFSLGWLFVPLISFMVVGALAASVGSFLLFPVIALGSVFALVSTLSSFALTRLDDKMIDDVMDSLDEDDRFDREELQRFDDRLRARSRTKF